MTVDGTTLDGMFKKRYGKIDDVVPDFAELQRDIKFKKGQRLGDEYVENVRLRRTNGHTFYGAGLDAFDLNQPQSGQRKPAKIQGTQYVLREHIAYGVVANSKTTEAAFADAYDDMVMDMKNSAAFALEMCLLYGGTHIGVAESHTDATTTGTLTLSKATWAAGLWAQAEGMLIDIYSAPGGTQRNTNGAITVTEVDADTRTLSISGIEADLNAITDDDVIIPYEADGKWFSGLKAITGNTGTLHSIDASTYGLWKGNVLPLSSAALNFLRLQTASTKILTRGGAQKLKAYVSPWSWTVLNNDEAALRRHVDKVGGKVEVGSTSIMYHGVAGVMEIKPHAMVMAGDAFVINPAKFKRIGSTDITFDLGIEGSRGKFFRELSDKAGSEVRAYWNQALMNCKPSADCRISGIVDGIL